MRVLSCLAAAAVIMMFNADTGPQAQRNRGGSSPFSQFHEKAEFGIGKPAPRLHCQDSDGKETDMREYLGRWVFIEFGSYT